MTQEDKQILLQDLCGRLQYGVICDIYNDTCTIKEKLSFGGITNFADGKICVRPYLRPISSMTEEEKRELRQISDEYLDYYWSTADSSLLKWKLDAKVSSKRATFYNSHHLDWNGLIEKNLAIEATAGMYDY